jgi:hypothetical protein
VEVIKIKIRYTYKEYSYNISIVLKDTHVLGVTLRLYQAVFVDECTPKLNFASFWYCVAVPNLITSH